MRRMRRKAEENNSVILIILYEFEFKISIKFVRNQQSIYILYSSLYRFIKITNSFIINISIRIFSFVTRNKIIRR